MKTVKELIDAYKDLNEVYNAIIGGKQYTYQNQKDVLEKCKECQKFLTTFRSAVYDMFIEVDKPKFHKILADLRGAIDYNMKSYNENLCVFNSIDIYKLCLKNSEMYSSTIKNIQDVRLNLNQQISSIDNSLDFANDREKIESLGVQRDDLKDEYDAWGERLAWYIEEAKRLERESSECYHDYFAEVYKLGQRFSTIIDEFMSDQDETKKVQALESDEPSIETEHPHNEIIFDMQTISKIHKLCNGCQFENINEEDFYFSINLQPSKSKLKVKSREKARVYYLIHRLYESYREKEDIDLWEKGILRYLGLDKNVYQKKYTSAGEDGTTRTNEKFVKEIDNILGLANGKNSNIRGVR